ncbi:GDP-mannose 4,6-dehydratase [bacterium]|nr:GDP-mannose 4,6-dehydratase [bacterium]
MKEQLERAVASGDWESLGKVASELEKETAKLEMEEKEKFYAPTSTSREVGEKTVLVTGAAGFIGSHLVERLLKEGYRVIGLDVIDLGERGNLKPYSEELLGNYIYDQDIKRQNVERCLGHSRYRFYENVDVRDEEALEKVFQENSINQVMHMAALAGVRDSFKAPQLYLEIDEKGTERMLAIAVRYQIKYFLYASSSSIYGGVNGNRPSKEEDVPNPRAPYPAAKVGAEVWAHTYHNMAEDLISSKKRGQDKPLCVCGLRFFTVYGRRGRRDMALRKFVELMARGKPIPIYGDGSQSRNFTHINDIVEGMVRALKNPHPDEIFNLGGEETTTLTDAIELLERYLEKKAIRDCQPLQLGDVHASLADTSKAERMLDYRPAISIKEGISDLCRWYQIWAPFKKAYNRYQQLRDEGEEYTEADLQEALSLRDELLQLTEVREDDSEYLVAYHYLVCTYRLIADICHCFTV